MESHPTKVIFDSVTPFGGDGDIVPFATVMRGIALSLVIIMNLLQTSSFLLRALCRALICSIYYDNNRFSVLVLHIVDLCV